MATSDQRGYFSVFVNILRRWWGKRWFHNQSPARWHFVRQQQHTAMTLKKASNSNKHQPVTVPHYWNVAAQWCTHCNMPIFLLGTVHEKDGSSGGKLLRDSISRSFFKRSAARACETMKGTVWFDTVPADGGAVNILLPLSKGQSCRHHQ